MPDVDAGVYAPAATQEGLRPLWDGGVESAQEHGRARLCKETFVHNTLLHLSVALCRGNCWVLRKGLHELTRATGRQFQRGLLHPTADLVA